MKKLLIMFAALTALALGGCSKDESPESLVGTVWLSGSPCKEEASCTLQFKTENLASFEYILEGHSVDEEDFTYCYKNGRGLFFGNDNESFAFNVFDDILVGTFDRSFHKIK